jgi:hypothetical protein
MRRWMFIDWGQGKPKATIERRYCITVLHRHDADLHLHYRVPLNRRHSLTIHV